MIEAKQEQANENGKELPATEAPEMTLPENAEVIEATPQVRLEQFLVTLKISMMQMRVEIRPFIRTYNDGRQIADYDIVALD